MMNLGRPLFPKDETQNLLVEYPKTHYSVVAVVADWSGYIIEPMQNKYSALKASIIIGIVWAIWHIIPYYQAHQSTHWIVWQCIGTVFFASSWFGYLTMLVKVFLRW
jgi:hypothetical protein